MTKPPQDPRRPTGSSPSIPPRKNAEVERALALRDVMDHAVRVQREISEAKPLHRRRGAMLALLLCVPLLAFSIYSLVARPEFIWGAAPVLPREQADANARIGLFLLAQRIEAVRAARGDYPESLTELGENFPGVTYAVVGDSAFELRAKADSATEIVFNSRGDIRQFLRNTSLSMPIGAR